MSEDEAAIRGLVAEWLAATQAGDVSRVLALMTDDAVFLTPGRPPFGREAFAAAAEAMKSVRFEGSSEIEEICVAGDVAYMRSRLAVAVTPPGGEAMRRSGYALTVLRRESDGRWRLARDANLLTDDLPA